MLSRYTALARLIAISGDGQGALGVAREYVEKGMAPKLRVFAPALWAFAVAREVSVGT